MTKEQFNYCKDNVIGSCTFDDGTKGFFNLNSVGNVNVVIPHEYNDWYDVIEYGLVDDEVVIVSEGVSK